jgi:hypothetical protein
MKRQFEAKWIILCKKKKIHPVQDVAAYTMLYYLSKYLMN